MKTISLKRFLLNAFLAALVAPTASCFKRQAIAISGVCLEDNDTIVRISGFLHQADNSSGAGSRSAFLVENKNGTGGFIEVQFDREIAVTSDREVVIKGKVLKAENSCLLKADIVENPLR